MRHRNRISLVLSEFMGCAKSPPPLAAHTLTRHFITSSSIVLSCLPMARQSRKLPETNTYMCAKIYSWHENFEGIYCLQLITLNTLSLFMCFIQQRVCAGLEQGSNYSIGKVCMGFPSRLYVGKGTVRLEITVNLRYCLKTGSSDTMYVYRSFNVNVCSLDLKKCSNLITGSKHPGPAVACSML